MANKTITERQQYWLEFGGIVIHNGNGLTSNGYQVGVLAHTLMGSAKFSYLRR